MAHESDLLRATPAQARGPAWTVPEMAPAIVNVAAGQAAATGACPPTGDQLGTVTASSSPACGPRWHQQRGPWGHQQSAPLLG